MAWAVYTEENFKKVVEHAPIGILIIDRDMKWRFVNERFCEITGYTREELAGKTFLDITYKDDVSLNLSLYNRLLNGEINEYNYEKRYVRKNGEIIWVRLAVSAVRTGTEYSHMVVSVEDIDATKKNQQMLEVRNDELDTLLYKASHDLKSPVTTLSGLCHVLSVEHPAVGKSDVFNHLTDTIERLKNQNESLLELTRIWEATPGRQRILLEILVREVVRDLSVTEADLTFNNLDQELITDVNLLRVAIRRIVENAVDYVQPGSKPTIAISFARIPGQSRIAIADKGIGIPVGELDSVLGMFHRASAQSRGSGLGLYIARKAIEKLHGDILVESEEGVGSSFIILLPA